MIVYFDDKRLDYVDLPTKLQHAIGGFSLLLVAISKFREGTEIAVAIGEFAIAAVVVFAFLAEMRALRNRHRNPSAKHAPGAMGWFDLAAGFLLIYEAFHGEHHKAGYLRPQFFSGIVTLALGLFHRRFPSLPGPPPISEARRRGCGVPHRAFPQVPDLLGRTCRR